MDCAAGPISYTGDPAGLNLWLTAATVTGCGWMWTITHLAPQGRLFGVAGFQSCHVVALHVPLHSCAFCIQFLVHTTCPSAQLVPYPTVQMPGERFPFYLSHPLMCPTGSCFFRVRISLCRYNCSKMCYADQAGFTLTPRSACLCLLSVGTKECTTTAMVLMHS